MLVLTAYSETSAELSIYFQSACNCFLFLYSALSLNFLVERTSDMMKLAVTPLISVSRECYIDFKGVAHSTIHLYIAMLTFLNSHDMD